jgi:sialic acid synthase SpsE
MALARELIDAAADCGVDAAKFQIYTADALYSRRTPAHSGYTKNLHTLISEIETPREWIEELAAHCARRGLVFFATPFDKEAADLLNPYSALFKIASFELVDLPLIAHVAAKGKPVVLSAGLANMDEVRDALDACHTAQAILLQCASLYPAPPDIVNLRAMKTMQDTFGIPTGLSDHTLGTHISVAATALGAHMIEKHFTLSRSLEGPDHPFAMEPADMKRLVEQVRDVEAALGDGEKRGPSEAESESYRIGRRSVHAARGISAGSAITADMLCTKRPGLGIAPKHIGELIGKTASRDIAADEWLTWNMLNA